MKPLNRLQLSCRVRSAIKHSSCALAASSWLLAGAALAAPANDDFANAIDLPNNSGIQTGTGTLDATSEVGEPVLLDAMNKTVWFKWTAPASGNFTLSTFGSTSPSGSEWDAVLEIYSGTTLTALTPVGNSPTDNSNEEIRTISVSAGDTYYVQIGGFQNQIAANIKLSWNLPLYHILKFGPSAVVGEVINNTAAINWNAPSGTNLSTAAPTFTLSPGATCDRISGAIPSPNFSQGPVVYTVSSQTVPPVVNTYTVTASVASSALWSLPSGGVWDLATPNWSKQPPGPATTFVNNDDAIFDNPAGGIINIPSAVAPSYTTVSAASGSYEFTGGPIAGSGSLIKSGSGSLTLNGTHTFSGDTVVNGGTLVVNGTDAIGGSTGFSVASGATLSLTGTTSTKSLWPEKAATLTGAGTVNVALGGQINVGFNFSMSTFSGKLNLSGGQTTINPDYSPGFIGLENATIIVEDNTTLYLGWGGNVFNTTVKLNGQNDYREGLGVLRGDTATLNGAVVLNTNSTIGSNSSGDIFTINSVISDGGNNFGFTTVGGGTVILAATANTYTGPTTVSTTSTLQCDTLGALGGGPLSITGKIKLQYTGTKNVASLTLGGVAKTATGTYGSTASGATFQDDIYFVVGSTGTVTVTVTSNYATWLNGFTFAPGANTTAAGDPDGDGVTNQKEYAFGLNPTLSSSVNPITQQLNKATGNFQYTRHANPAATGIIYIVQTSNDLVSWTPGTTTETGLTTANNIETVTVKVTNPAVNGKLFVRVEAKPAP
jgi:autotransporter-associated beta strand protein